MHEVGLAAEILYIAQTSAQEAGFASITRIKVVIGNQRMITPEALSFAFSFINKDSCTKTAELEIEDTEGTDFYVDYVEGE